MLLSSMNKTTFLMTAVLTIATVLTAGLTVLPSSVQEVRAENPCNIDTFDIDAEEVGNNCDFYGNTEIDASTELPVRPPPPTGILVPIPLDD
jgi:hypothetical protein